MTTRKELVEALRERYRSAAFGDRIKILDEFVALTGYHRKHAIRVLRDEVTKTSAASARNRLYDEAVRQALTMLWEAADRVCGKRLKALIPLLVDVMERHGHLGLDPIIRSKVLQVSAATIDRMLTAARFHIDVQRKRRKGVGSAIRRSIPVRTVSDWRDPPPGFFEIDMVEHCGGPKTDGDYVHTLTMTERHGMDRMRWGCRPAASTTRSTSLELCGPSTAASCAGAPLATSTIWRCGVWRTRSEM